MTTTRPFQLGTVIQGTLRTEDLLPAFAGTLEELDQTHELVKAAYEHMAAWGTWENAKEELDEEETGTGLIESLMDAINGHCPPFVYFGPHPGDGADFGFWPDHDALHDAVNEEGSSWDVVFGGNNREIILHGHRCILHVDGDDVAIMDLDRNSLWTTA